VAIIPGDIKTFNDGDNIDKSPLSEAVLSKIGATINGLTAIAKKPQFSAYTASGSFLLPQTALPTVFLVGIGGGGGGAGGSRYTVDVYATDTGGGGGGGGILALRPLEITPGTSYSVTIGAGGAGGIKNTNGQPGNPTIFGNSLAVFDGGRPGLKPLSSRDGSGGAGGSPGQSGGPSRGRGGSGLIAGPAPLASASDSTGCGGSGGYGIGANTDGKSGGSGFLVIIYFDTAL
jgi:hypothetical protein